MTGPPAQPSPRDLIGDFRRGIDSMRRHLPGDSLQPIERITDMTLDELPPELAVELRQFTERTGRAPLKLAHYVRMEDGVAVRVFDDAFELAEDRDVVNLSQTIALVAADRTAVRIDSFTIQLAPAA